MHIPRAYVLAKMMKRNWLLSAEEDVEWQNLSIFGEKFSLFGLTFTREIGQVSKHISQRLSPPR